MAPRAGPVICFDGDRAGRAAAARSLDRILPLLRTGVSFRYAFLQDADPDEVIRRNGLDRFRSSLADASPLWDMLWEREFQGMGEMRTPDHKAVFEKKLMELVAAIGDQLLRESYRKRRGPSSLPCSRRSIGNRRSSGPGRASSSRNCCSNPPNRF